MQGIYQNTCRKLGCAGDLHACKGTDKAYRSENKAQSVFPGPQGSFEQRKAQAVAKTYFISIQDMDFMCVSQD